MRGKMNFLLLLPLVITSSVTPTDFSTIIDQVAGVSTSEEPLPEPSQPVEPSQPSQSSQPSEPSQPIQPPTFKPRNRPDTMAAFGIPYHMWHCGSGEYITNSVIVKINATCPAVAADFNHCCAVHDDCYGNQRGRGHCDEQFCKCLKYFSESSEEGKPCKQLSSYACSMIEQFGEVAYKADAEGDNAPKPDPYIPKELAKIEKEYKKVYEKCKSQRVTLESCALNHDICRQNPTLLPPQTCTLNLLRCLDDTRNDREPDGGCDLSVEEFLFKLVSPSPGGQKPEKEVAEGSGDGGVEGSGEGGDVNVLMLQGIMRNQTFVRKIYLQIVKTTSSFSWIVYFCFFLCIFLCCAICIIGLTRTAEDDRRRRFHQDDVINVHVSSTTSGAESSKKKTSSESEAPPSSTSSIKK